MLANKKQLDSLSCWSNHNSDVRRNLKISLAIPGMLGANFGYILVNNAIWLVDTYQLPSGLKFNRLAVAAVQNFPQIAYPDHDVSCEFVARKTEPETPHTMNPFCFVLFSATSLGCDLLCLTSCAGLYE